MATENSATGRAVATGGGARTPRRRRTRDAGLVIGLVLLGAVLALAVLAPVLYREAADVMGPRAQRPSGEHVLGTDAAGHDVLLRALVATRLTILMTVGACATSVVGGVLLGLGAWTLDVRAREVVLRAIDAVVAFPGLLLALVVAAVLGAGGTSAAVAIGLAGIPYFARLSANLAARTSRQEFVSTARSLGVPPVVVAVRHVLPNIAEPLLVLAASNFAQSLTAISAMSFVGLGAQSPSYDWGKLLNEAIPSLLSGRSYEIVGPAVLIVVTGLAAILVGDGLAAGARPGARRRPPPRGRDRAPAPVVDDPSSALLRVRDLRIASGDTELVRGVSFEVMPGEVVGIVGESGSGKTLTATAVARLLPDDLQVEAEVLQLGSTDLLAAVDDRVLAHDLAVIYQDPATTFNPALRMGHQLTRVLREHFGHSRRQARDTVVRALASTRLTQPEERMRQYPHELSGGMRQRAMIASALSTGPRLIIADEATTALDVTVQAEILRELKRVNVELGCSVLFISHDIGVVRALCDRVVVMYRGEVVETLRASALTSEGAAHPYTRRLLAATPQLRLPSTPRSGGVVR